MSKEHINKLCVMIGDSILGIQENSYNDVTDSIIELCGVLDHCDDDSIWECGSMVSLESIIVGSYWHYVANHNGQGSRGYSALSSLGNIYNPNRSNGPDDDESRLVYEQLNSLVPE